ncbi:chitobiase/beta-hexosaminidase C-terminal domain-containing protein [candidate division KSB1 bacterium]|nr:chitobiase/beta-hexosaminidase C-terminal domain-containing protein [candidate division KSB1 bacterium]
MLKKNILFIAKMLAFAGYLQHGYATEINAPKIFSSNQVRELFKNPPVEFRSAPLWVWNDDVTEQEIDRQLKDLKNGGIGGVFIHPRPGLITPYLSDRWFSLCKYTVDKCKEMGMQAWLYDENSYPSGFAGGHVPVEMPESYNQGQGIVMHLVEKLPETVDEKIILILKKDGSEYSDITNQHTAFVNQSGDYYLFEKTDFGTSPRFGGGTYVDLLLNGVTDKFIEVTMTGYEKVLGDEIGKSVPGIFTDEPNINPDSGVKWTPALFEKFEQRWGYDLKPHLLSLFLETGDWKRVRHNYYKLLLELFIENWSKPWHAYCEKKNFAWTGHYWEHGWPNPKHGGDNMAMYAWHQMPAIDLLMNQYSEDVNAQFGNVRIVKELSSVANQMGRARTLSETYGAGGWDLTFEDMKRIGDWEYALGVNFMNQHLSYISIKGARKRDHPQSFSYHEPWWYHYATLGDYYARLSLALSSGQQINKILVIEPTTTSWMYYSPTESNKKLFDLGDEFQQFVVELEKYQIEYDLAAENILKDIGKVDGKKFVAGERAYDLVVFPPALENLDSYTFDLIRQYLKNGGRLLSVNSDLKFVDGAESEKSKSSLKKYSVQWTQTNSLTNANLKTLSELCGVVFIEPEKIHGKLFHHRRTFNESEMLFLVNTSLEEWSTGTFRMKGKSVDEFNLFTGELAAYPYRLQDNSVIVDFDLPPAGSLLLNVSNAARKLPLQSEKREMKIVSPMDTLTVKRTAPNVLTLDYCDLTMNGETENDIYVFDAAVKLFKNVGFNRQPWVRAVQYKNDIIDRNHFTEVTRFEAAYRFTVEPGVETSSIRAVAEQPELWELAINGAIVDPNPDESWLDRSFGVYNIGDFVVEGMNEVKLIAPKMTVFSELEAIYILGEFDLKSQEKGWRIAPASRLSMGSWKEQGMPFYADGVSYTKTFQIHTGNKRYIVSAPFWEGSVVEVHVNKKDAGIIAWQPDELDITNFIKNGENEISLSVIGTLRNLLGPHHIGPTRGNAWPAGFHSAPQHQPPGNVYDLLDYGLLNDFNLIEYAGAPQRVYQKYLRVVTPKIQPEKRIFLDKTVTITLTTITDEAEIFYTLNGNTPDETSARYSKPITTDESCTVKAIAYRDGWMKSPMAERAFSIVGGNNGVNYHYYEGNWKSVPEFTNLEPVKKGKVFEFNLENIDYRDNHFAIEFIGQIHINKAGEYTFFTNSDDGSKLFIDGAEVVNNDGAHGTQFRQGTVTLTPGAHHIKVDYFEDGGGEDLTVYYEGPGISRQIIPAFVLFKN